jgi:short-subunit dehydrogenase
MVLQMRGAPFATELIMEKALKPIADQVMVITGASSGIGLATALAAAERGAKLVLVARSGETLQDVVTEINEIGGRAIAITADVGNRTAMLDVAAAALAAFGRIDTWINNAGVSIYGRLDQVSDEDNRRLFETNFWGVVNGSLIALPHLRSQGGALINVGSEVSDAVAPLQGMYSTSKHAVKGFTDALRVEVEHVDNAPVSVTLIQPTAVNTPYPRHARNYLAAEPKLPDQQIQPTQVAEAILKAACEGGRDVTVGTMSTFNTVISKLLPRLADKIASKQIENQKEPFAARNRQGALHKPGGHGNVYGQPPR